MLSQGPCAVVTVDAAQDEGCPEKQACPHENLSGKVPFNNWHRGYTPEHVNVHQSDGENKNESEHWPSTIGTFILSSTPAPIHITTMI
jgi:hypothetical protein